MTFSFESVKKMVLPLQRKNNIMSRTETITTEKTSRKLEEAIRKVGVQKYLRLEKLCSDEIIPMYIVKV